MTKIPPRASWLPQICGGLALVFFAAPIAQAWDKGKLSDYHERRARLVHETGDGVVVLFGYSEDEIAISTTTFRQNEMFYYLTGWNEPDGILLLVPNPAAAAGRRSSGEIGKEILFIPSHDYSEEKWTGPKLGPDDPAAPARTGFPTVKSASLFPAALQEALKTFPKIYTELTPQPESGEDNFIKEMVAKLHQLAPLTTFADLRMTLTRMRMVKSPAELELIRKAVEASVDAHLAAMKAVHPGVWEYEIAALMNYEYARRGCEWPSYPPIVGSGFFSTVLHYDQDENQMKNGDVVVMDVAGSYSGYASDITRTLPVNGHFTARQREIYEIVLGAQNAVLAAAKPGMSLSRGEPNSLQSIAYNYIDTHGKDLQGNSLGQYFIHGVGHHIGLNVHDPAVYDLPLQANMVITDEPGIYIPEEKIGVRIEDDVLITPDGAEVLSRRLPRTVDEIEKLMAH
ncbi:MAG TPA: aminopeptidase P N-terminal domain-containing protein [Terriglobia bacterium]|nr:aminopeptidase P N-terminal domain-containing protein [Terriglobia bacterium]